MIPVVKQQESFRDPSMSRPELSADPPGHCTEDGVGVIPNEKSD